MPLSVAVGIRLIWLIGENTKGTLKARGDRVPVAEQPG